MESFDSVWYWNVDFERGEKVRIVGAPNDALGVIVGISIGYDDTIIYQIQVRKDAIYPYGSEYIWLPRNLIEAYYE